MRGRAKEQKAEPALSEEMLLLQKLIETPPQSAQSWRPAIALRSVDQQRRHALGQYSFRTWFDHALKHTERLLIIVALLFFGYWLYDGPIRDWLYTRSTPVAQSASPNYAAQPRAAQTVNQATQSDAELQSAPLPYISAEMAQQESQSDFLAPGLSLVPARPKQVSGPERLLIPSIGVDTIIKEVFVVDGAWEVADYAAGYMHGTALPGEKGTMAFAGHAGMRGAVFRDLPSIAIDDDIFVDADGWRYRYRVSATDQVWPTQTEVLASTPDPSLILITCTNWDTQRYIVRANLIESKPIVLP